MRFVPQLGQISAQVPLAMRNSQTHSCTELVFCCCCWLLCPTCVLEPVHAYAHLDARSLRIITQNTNAHARGHQKQYSRPASPWICIPNCVLRARTRMCIAFADAVGGGGPKISTRAPHARTQSICPRTKYVHARVSSPCVVFACCCWAFRATGCIMNVLVYMLLHVCV